MLPRMIVKNLARAGERFDNRGIEEARRPVVERVSNSCLVTVGRSRLLAVFQRGVVKPYVDKPHEGIVGFSMSASSRRHEKVLNFLHKVYVKQKSIDVESLCVKPNEEVVLIHIDLRVLCCDGNIHALAVHGVNSALEALGVKMNYTPQCFFYCSIGGTIVSDPTEDEQASGEWGCVAVMKSSRELVFLEKMGEECSMEALVVVADRSSRDFVVSESSAAAAK